MNYQPPSDLPAEFALALACCRWAYAEDSSDVVQALAKQADWARFLDTCRRQRVQGLAWHTLSGLGVNLPASVRSALETDARNIAEHGLRAAHESAQLEAAFNAAELPLCFLKGLPLASLVYKNPFLKMSMDVDVLVLPEHVARAAFLLKKLGYRLEIPKAERKLGRWHQLWKESIWRGTSGIILELHSRVADQQDLIPGITARPPRRIVAVAEGIELPTLSDEHQFAYLAVHGASSAWFRLKWITDLAAFLSGRSAADIERLYDRSQELGASNAAAQALLLAHRLYAVPLSKSLAERLRMPPGRWLADVALAEMLRAEPGERPLGTRMIHLTQFFLRPGLFYKARELWRQMRVAAGIF